MNYFFIIVCKKNKNIFKTKKQKNIKNLDNDDNQNQMFTLDLNLFNHPLSLPRGYNFIGCVYNIINNPYKKVTVSVCVCLFVTKDLANSCTAKPIWTHLYLV